MYHRAIKVFEVIHLVLILGLVVAVPSVAMARPSGQEFSWSLSLKQAGVATLIFIALLLLNFIIARIVLRRFPQTGVTR
jgi:hypothetical protein